MDRREPAPVEPIEQSPLSDWTDQDLLTRDVARDLLEAEIAAERARREGDHLTADDRARIDRRIDSMVHVIRRFSEPSNGQ